MGTWSSGIGKFVKKDPNHGKLWRKIKSWILGLPTLRKAKKGDIPSDCCDKGCGCHKRD